MVTVMKTVWKVLIGLALVVPLAAYVVGSLAASASEDRAPRHTIQIEQPAPSPTSRPTRTPPSPTGPDEVEVITPHYEDFDDHDDHGDDDGDHGDDRDDHGGDDEHSGHGGGDDD
jgi:hypothetical protein